MIWQHVGMQLSVVERHSADLNLPELSCFLFLVFFYAAKHDVCTIKLKNKKKQTLNFPFHLFQA